MDQQPVQRGTVLGPDGKPMLSMNHASPGISGAIMDAIAALAHAFAPRAVTQHVPATEQAIAAQSEGTPPQQPLGNQF
jgi:hypothetical protein